MKINKNLLFISSSVSVSILFYVKFNVSYIVLAIYWALLITYFWKKGEGNVWKKKKFKQRQFFY